MIKKKNGNKLSNLERSIKSDSYIFAIQNNEVPLNLKFSPDFEDAISKTQLLINNLSNVPPLNFKELEYYKNDSFWKKLRWSLYFAFWIVCVVLITNVIFILIGTPKCGAITSRKWWKNAVIYEIWTSSFDDSNNDGFGDLNGLETRLNELRKVGINTIFLKQFLDVEESGIGVKNFVKIHENIGDMKIASKFINNAHKKGFHVIMDFPLTTTFISHPWFRRSANAFLPENAPFAGFYFWRRNWENSEFISEFQKSSLFYFHQKNRPDLPILNWDYYNVSKAIKRALSFWIDKDIDGFHLSDIDYLYRSVDGLYPDWNEIFPIVRNIREHIDKYNKQSLVAKNKDIFVFASPENLNEEEKRRLIIISKLDAVVNTELTKIALKNKICYESENSVVGCTNEVMSDLLLFHETNPQLWPMWSLENSFTSRLPTRVGSKKHAEMLFMLLMMLPGTSIFYYGSELGLEDSPRNLSFPQRGPMLWSDSKIDGLSAEVSEQLNFQTQYSNSKSQLRLFQKLIKFKLRSELLYSGYSFISPPINNGFALCRYQFKEDNMTFGEILIVAVNFGQQSINQSLLDLPPFHLKQESINAEVVAATTTSTSPNYYYKQRLKIFEQKILLGPNQGIVFLVL